MRTRQTTRGALLGIAVLMVGAVCGFAAPAAAQEWTLVGWNNLGMHCMDADFSLFAILPPFNTFHAQLIDPQGRLVGDPAAAGITVTYEGVADPDGSRNTTSIGKTNFWRYAPGLFGTALPENAGVAGFAMPGPGNAALPMRYDAASGWFIAEGVPITPYDDAGRKNYYPLMRLVARDRNGVVLTHTDIVLPVSDELSCKGCHGSGSDAAARPASGWAFDPDAERDFRINVLQLHDDRHLGETRYQNALAVGGYSPLGLLASAAQDVKATLCATCHASEALPGSGQPGIAPLTQSVHGAHLLLDAGDQGRTACYQCHPGSVTRCLRGAMGAAQAADGSLAMQCQSCHGSMRDVAATTRTGWLDEPTCQSCHTGTALRNNGAIRFTSVFAPGGGERQAVDATFATNPNTPAPGLSLYRFSTGHGGLQCAACHGSTHAEYPAAHRNDNLQNIALQGHAGMLAECASCHPAGLDSVSGGPHGIHSIGNRWVDQHGSAAEDGGAAACRACHGADYRGTELSRVQADRILQTDFGSKVVWRGFQVSCFMCHNGPSSEDASPNRAPVVSNLAVTTATGVALPVALGASDADGHPLSLRIVTQAEHGPVGLTGTTATFHPDPGYSGADRFTYAAWDGSTNSNLGTVSITVGGAPSLPSATPSWTPLPSRRPSATATPRPTAAARPLPSSTSTRSPTVAATPVRSATVARTPTPGRSATPTRRATVTRTATATRRATATRTPPAAPTRTRTLRPTRTPTMLRAAVDDD